MGGGQGGEKPNKLEKNCLMFFLKNFRERKADSDQNVLREVSVFLRKFEESGRKLKKNIEIFFFKLGASPPLLPHPKTTKNSKISEKSSFDSETWILICSNKFFHIF